MNIPPLKDLVPADKKLDPAWLASLTRRGAAQVCSDAELNYIGMPIGGLFSGQLFIGGDGQLWNWDVFNDYVFTGWSGNYGPVKPTSPLDQKFWITINEGDVPLDRSGFSQTTFRGEYPFALVNYRDPARPVEVRLEAFSPFIPLNLDDSCLPLTVMSYTIKNNSDKPVRVSLHGSLENFVLNRERGALNGMRVNKISNEGKVTVLEETVSAGPAEIATRDRLIEDWSKSAFEGWTLEGTAFGQKPLSRSGLSKEHISAGFDKLGDEGSGFVTSLSVGADFENHIASGSLTSAPFTVDRAHLYVWVKPEGRLRKGAAVELLVDGKVVDAIEPKFSRLDARGLHLYAFDVQSYSGKQVALRIAHDSRDAKTGITVGRIFLSDREILFNTKTGKVETRQEAEDNGSMALALLDGPADLSSGNQEVPATQKLVGQLGRSLELKPGESREITFLVSWFFPNMNYLRPAISPQGRWYSSKFDSASDVVRYFVQNRGRLTADTRKWRDTWYDSTLPFWFLDRTMIPVCNLATSTNHRFTDGRWWAWEGVGSCEGTCGHVYSYAQSVAALFPSLERDQRERVDFGLSQAPEGWIDSRGECKDGVAVDAQACYILRVLREHRMSADQAFLKRLWPRVQRATDFLIAQDGRESGILRGAQHNTLDSKWYGEVAWLSGLYQAALLASAEMAGEMGDAAYAEKCARIAEAGRCYMVENLFNGEYYQNKLDPDHPDAINSGSGCLIDQVAGQAWGSFLGLPRVFPKEQTMKSLQSLWRYNFCPDAGRYRTLMKAGRRYVDPGESGVLICTFPRPDWDFVQASGRGQSGLFAGYFNECMTGFEHQLAAHMIREGMITEGLAIERAIHDRYAPAKRNPYNEVECGDFYGRVMASYGVYLAVCGFDYNGPEGRLGFAPQITPTDFKCAFTSAEGWGTFWQKQDGVTFSAGLDLKYGKLKLRRFVLSPDFPKSGVIRVSIDGAKPGVQAAEKDGHVELQFTEPIELAEGQSLHVTLTKP